MVNSVGLKIWQGINHYEHDLQFASPIKSRFVITKLVKLSDEFIRSWNFLNQYVTRLKTIDECEHL